jgi:hypothetical protein
MGWVDRNGRERHVIGRISTDVQQARRLSQVVCGVVIAAATLFSAPMAHVEPGVAVAGVAGVAGVAATGAVLVARAGRRLRH